MKTLGKTILGDSPINPINRDLLLVTISGLLIALAIGTAAVMVIGQF
jgi:hypothetical protein